YVANRATANIAVIYGRSAQKFIPLAANPSALVADAAHNRIYGSTYETPTLYMIENDSVTKQATIDGHINALALDGDSLYVALDNDAIIEQYDANTFSKIGQVKLSQGFGVSALAVDK